VLGASITGGLIALALWGCGGHGQRTPLPLLSTRVDLNDRGIPLPQSFLGLSSDWNVVFTRTGISVTGANPLYDRLVALLGRYGGGAPTLRVGGNYQDAAWWNPTGEITNADRARGLSTPIIAPVLQGLALNARATGQRMILGLNLAVDDPALVQAEVRAILRYVPRRDIIAFAIGNEPDAYANRWRWQQYVAGKLVIYRTRGRSYSAADYLREWRRMAAAVASVAPGVPLAGPDGYGTLISPASFLGNEHARIASYTQHYYAASACDAQGHPYAADDPQYMTVARLLGGAGTASLGPARTAVQVAARYGKPVRIDETNSTACGGRADLGGVFGSALWALDQFFTDALIGVQGVDLHGDDWRETPFVFRYDPSRRRWSGYAGALYYAMLAFAQATGSHGRLLVAPTLTAKLAPGANARVYAVRQPDGGLRVLVINKGLQRAGTVALALPDGGGAGTLVRLRAPSASAVGGITFAGQVVDTSTPDARLNGRYRSEAVRPSHGVYRFFLPAASAATLSVPASGR
jgi:hypothetical protein